MDPQALDPVDMDGKCVNPHKAVKEALTTKTAGARANPTPSTGGTVPRSPYQLGSGNGTTIARRCRRLYVQVWIA